MFAIRRVSDGGNDLGSFVEGTAVLRDELVAEVGQKGAAVLLDLAFVEGKKDGGVVGSEGVNGALESFEFGSFDVALDDVGWGGAVSNEVVNGVDADGAGTLICEPAHGGGGTVFEHHLTRFTAHGSIENCNLRHFVQGEMFPEGCNIGGDGFDGHDMLRTADPGGKESVEADMRSRVPETGSGVEGGGQCALLAEFIAAQPGSVDGGTRDPLEAP